MSVGGRNPALLLAVIALNSAVHVNVYAQTAAMSGPRFSKSAALTEATEGPIGESVAARDLKVDEREPGLLWHVDGGVPDEERGPADHLWRQVSWSLFSGWSDRTANDVSQYRQAAGVGALRAQPYEWQMLPQGLMYHAYVAGEKEPRIGLSMISDPDLDGIWEAALGGRIGIIRYGTRGAVNPEGWQIDLEGAALSRIDRTAPSAPLHATDYRIGMQWTRRKDGTAVKVGYYHISSHVGDEYLLANPGFVRLNYVRDSLILGVTQDLTRDLQGYGEIGYALGLGGGSEPLEFQFGLQYEQRNRTNCQGSPFAAINFHLREEVDFGGGLNVLAGWRWRGAESGHVLRIGLQFYNGKSLQYSFLRQSEQFVGTGIWVDY